MFGNLGAFVHGNMFAGLFGSAVGVRLAEPDASELAAIDGSGPFGPDGHAMAGYISLPAAWRDDARLASSWVDKARDHVSTRAVQPGRLSTAPAAMALTSCAWSLQFWSAYERANRPMAAANLAPFPM